MPDVATAPWTCESNFVLCTNKHLLSFNEKRDGWRADMRRMQGHAFIECKKCQPPTFFFAVFVTKPDSHAVCYAINEASFRRWDTDPEAVTLSTPEMLFRLRDPDGHCFNPGWRPAR